MALFTTANIQELLNAGIYAPLTGISKPMVEAIADLPTPLKAGQAVDATGALATDNATHVIAGSHVGLIGGEYNFDETNKHVPGVVLGQALIDVEITTGETIVIGDTVTFVDGLLIKAVGGEAQTFTAEAVEGLVARIKFK